MAMRARGLAGRNVDDIDLVILGDGGTVRDTTIARLREAGHVVDVLGVSDDGGHANLSVDSVRGDDSVLVQMSKLPTHFAPGVAGGIAVLAVEDLIVRKGEALMARKSVKDVVDMHAMPTALGPGAVEASILTGHGPEALPTVHRRLHDVGSIPQHLFARHGVDAAAAERIRSDLLAWAAATPATPAPAASAPRAARTVAARSVTADRRTAPAKAAATGLPTATNRSADALPAESASPRPSPAARKERGNGLPRF